MRLLSPEGSDLMFVEKVDVVDGNIVVHGKIMGALPMKAILKPDELRSGMRLLNAKLIRTALAAIIFRRPKKK